MITKKISLFLALAMLFLIPAFSSAATLRLEPSFSEHKMEDTFILDIQINTEEECINAIGVNLQYPQQILKGEDFSIANSVLEIWPQDPNINQEEGLVSFSGGIPGGFCSENEFKSLGEIIFKTKEVPRKIVEKVVFLEVEAFLDDGLATKAETITESGYFVIFPDYGEDGESPWEKRLEEDNTPPESFDLEIRRDSSIYGNQKALFFSTVDYQTGVDYYEVLEQKRIGFLRVGSKDWQRAKSPYLLEDQKMMSIIKVKAVDKAGNERVEEFTPDYGWQDVGPWVLLILIIGINIWKLKRDKDGKLKVEWI